MAGHIRTYEQSTRNWLMAGAVLACAGLTALGAQNGAPWFWLAIVALPGVAAGAGFLSNRRGGWRVCPAEVYFHDGETWDLRLNPEQILWVSVHPNSEGPDAVRIHLRGGSVRELPDHCTGRVRELVAALRDVGVEVRA